MIANGKKCAILRWFAWLICLSHLGIGLITAGIGKQFIIGEISSGAIRLSAVPVHDDIFRRDMTPVLEIFHQCRKGGHLCRCWRGFVEVSHKAYAYAIMIVLLNTGMGAIYLSYPSITDLNLPIRGPISVPDNKMISKTILPSLFSPVISVKFCGAAGN